MIDRLLVCILMGSSFIIMSSIGVVFRYSVLVSSVDSISISGMFG